MGAGLPADIRQRVQVQCLVPARGARRGKALDEVGAAIPGATQSRGTSYSTVSGSFHVVERFSVSPGGNRLSGLWSFTGALTSHIVLHFLRFSDTFRGESRQIDRKGRSLSIFSATKPGFPETVTLGPGSIILWINSYKFFLPSYFLLSV